MLPSTISFDQLPLFFEGNSRILRQALNSPLLICKLKPTVFSIEKNEPVVTPGIDLIRTKLNALLCEILHQQGIKTSTVATKDGFIFMEKQTVPPIEVVVKGALVGSPKHLYKGIDKTPTRFNQLLQENHTPYVRFDWRNPLPLEDACMPTALAEYFIDTGQASETALKAFKILCQHFQEHDLELLDICFFMNTEGNVICAEISTDNCRLNYIGLNPDLKELIATKNKDMSVGRAQAILNLLL